MTEILPPYAGLTEECPKSECIELPAAMLAAAPSPDDPLYSAYMTGAHAAIKRRQHPVAQPDRYAPVLAMPSSDSDLRYGPIGIEEMPYLSAPVVEMIREEMPDMVMAADRGGRILGLSVYGVWQASYPSVPFPTIDSKLHFGRVSKRIDNDAVRNVIRHTLSSSGVTAEMAQRAAEGDARPLKVVFLDDWINEGVTVDQVYMAMQELALAPGQDLHFMVGTMRGTRHARFQHAVGDSRREHGKGLWTDDSEQIGVRYDDAAGIIPTAVHSLEAISLRRALRAAIESQVAIPRAIPDQTSNVSQLPKGLLPRILQRLRK